MYRAILFPRQGKHNLCVLFPMPTLSSTVYVPCHTDTPRKRKRKKRKEKKTPMSMLMSHVLMSSCNHNFIISYPFPCLPPQATNLLSLSSPVFFLTRVLLLFWFTHSLTGLMFSVESDLFFISLSSSLLFDRDLFPPAFFLAEVSSISLLFDQGFF